MVLKCAVPTCLQEKSNNVQLHCFPRLGANEADLWIANIGRVDLFQQPKDRLYRNYRVCSSHFSEKQWIVNGTYLGSRLRRDAVPDLNLPFTSCELVPPAAEKDHNNTGLITNEVLQSAITYKNVKAQPTLEDILTCDDDFLNIKSSKHEKEHNYSGLNINELSRNAITDQNVISHPTLEDMVTCEDDFLNIRSRHICLFCMKVLDKTNEFNIQSNVTKEGNIVEAFIKSSLLISMDEHLESYFVCLNCLDMVNELEQYFMKCKNIQVCLAKQYAEHKQSKESKHYSNGKELLTLNVVEDGRQIDLTIQCDTKDYATKETQTYEFSTQQAEESNLRESLSKPDENEMNVEIKAVKEKKPAKKSTRKEKKIKIDPYSSSGYFCEKCGKVFWKYNAFKYHALWHENRFQCEICNKSFVQQSNLKLHSLIHSGIRPHECETCGKKFRTRPQLDNHKKAVHPSATDGSGYCCETCGKLYVSYYGFNMHRQTHRYANKLRCEICDKSFTQLAGLRKHIRMHLDIRPFECNICEKRYRTNAALKTHLNSHNGIRNYQCDTCGKAFFTRPNLRNHMNIHLTIKPYICPVCQRGFSHRCNMKKHVQCVHKNEYRF